MRAAVYHGGGRVTLEERPAPVAGPGELLVRVRACGICGSDLMGWYQDPRAPMVPGHEPAGEVAAAGEGAPLAVGTRVAVHHHVPCMACPLCRRGRHTLCPRFRETHLEPGGMAEYVRVPAANAALDVLPLPDDLPLWAATLVEPLGCVVRGQRAAGVGPGARVAVVGAGGMGLLEIQAARALGAAAVVACEPRPERRARAARAGARVHADVAGARDDPALAGGADQVFVTTASPAAIAASLDLAGPGGAVQLFAPPPPGEPVALDLGAVWWREVSIGSTYSAGPFDTRDALAMLARGDVDPELVVSHRVPLDRVEEAFRLARGPEAIKVVVEL
ncbi:MAG TPA: alcohol dehydrogenase catalytic domain-containing protein [Miltoncostaeaceae bacterium]|nr:alcohol dehydrogenase catalytic domain-containing protein [Miltoncostaeaceae bacterium]